MTDFRATFDLANGTALTPANTGYNTVTSARAQVADTALKHVGSASAKITGTGLTTWTQPFSGTTPIHYRRVYIHMDGLPSATTRLWVFRNATDTADIGDVRITAAGQVQIRNSSLIQSALSAMSLSVGQWYRIEVAMVSGTATVRIFAGAKLDNAVTDPSEQISGAYTSQPMKAVYAGAPSNTTWNVHLDDEAGSDTSWVDTAFPSAPPGGPITVVGAFGSNPYGTSVAQVGAVLPGTVQAGDIALAMPSINAPSRTLQMPTGWTPLDGPDDIPNNKRSYLLKRLCTDADAGATLTTIWSGTGHPVVHGLVVRGADPDIDGWVVAHSVPAQNTDDFVVPAWTPKVDDVMAVLLSSANAGAGVTLTPPVIYNEDWDKVTTAAQMLSSHVAHRVLTGGAGVQQGGASGTFSGPVTNYTTYVVSLGPAGSVTPPPGGQYRWRYHDGAWRAQRL